MIFLGRLTGASFFTRDRSVIAPRPYKLQVAGVYIETCSRIAVPILILSLCQSAFDIDELSFQRYWLVVSALLPQRLTLNQVVMS